MSGTTASLHVHGASRDRFLALVVAKIEEDGFELLDEPTDREPELRRVVVNRSSGWVSFAEETMTTPDTWATYLSIGLDLPVLALWTWDGEGTVVVKCFRAGRQVASLELPRDVERGADGRARAPLDALDPWVSPSLRDVLQGRLILDDGPSSYEDGNGEHSHVDMDDSLAAIASAIGRPRFGIDPRVPDPDAGDLELVFLPSGAGSLRSPRTKLW